MSLNQLSFTPKDNHERELRDYINQIILGNLNNTSSVTLTANAASTTVTNSRVGANSYIEFMPTTANAATEKAAGTMYVSSRSKGEFVITHANNAQTDRTFVYTHIG